jgi:hypothetical protein
MALELCHPIRPPVPHLPPSAQRSITRRELVADTPIPDTTLDTYAPRAPDTLLRLELAAGEAANALGSGVQPFLETHRLS